MYSQKRLLQLYLLLCSLPPFQIVGSGIIEMFKIVFKWTAEFLSTYYTNNPELTLQINLFKTNLRSHLFFHAKWKILLHKFFIGKMKDLSHLLSWIFDCMPRLGKIIFYFLQWSNKERFYIFPLSAQALVCYADHSFLLHCMRKRFSAPSDCK